jgi:ubiquinone/menaquinone biosynthesis C-methylase UbiE
MRPPDPHRMQDFSSKLIGDLGAAMSGALVVLGDRLGLFKSMSDGKSVSPEALAARTGLDARCVAEWLAAMAAAGYVEPSAKGKRFRLSAEQGAAFADDGGPSFITGAFDIAHAMWLDTGKIEAAFRGGAGLAWREHAPSLFDGAERFFRARCNADLVSSWIPALKGVQEKLESGAKVADVGCGHGAALILMALAFPNAKFFGYDNHAPSIARAKQRAQDAGVAKRVSFTVASAKDFPGEAYDLVTCFDTLHELGDPTGAGAHVREALAKDGAWMIVEPFAHDDATDNFTPMGRIYYAASTMICTPAALAQEGGEALGAQAGEARIRKVVKAAGFAKFRRAAATPYNLVFEARA